MTPKRIHEAAVEPPSGHSTVGSLTPEDLLDKWGFGDGDVAGEWLAEWAEHSWVREALAGDEDESHPVSSYLDSRALLGAAVRELLLPTLDFPTPIVTSNGSKVTFQLRRIGTVHNPWRLVSTQAWQPDGIPIDVEDLEVETWEEAEMVLSEYLHQQAGVTVTKEWLDRRCDELYPPRSAGWLEMFQTLCWHLDSKDRESYQGRQDIDGWHEQTVAIVDDAVRGYGDAQVRLAAEMLDSLTQSDGRFNLSMAQVRRALSDAHLVIGEPGPQPHAATPVHELESRSDRRWQVRTQPPRGGSAREREGSVGAEP